MELAGLPELFFPAPVARKPTTLPGWPFVPTTAKVGKMSGHPKISAIPAKRFFFHRPSFARHASRAA